jgi:single-strand DNA-binding protein
LKEEQTMYQKLTIIGNLGRDPEMRYTPSGQAVTTLNVATTRKWAGNDGKQHEETMWIRVSVWGKQAETCNQYLSKGSKVFVEGRLNGQTLADGKTVEPRVWTDQGGTHRASYEMTASEVKFLSGRGEGGGTFEGGDSGGFEGGPSPAGRGAIEDNLGINEDEIPF